MSIFSETQRPVEAWLARSTPEPALDPRLPIIDAHLHFWHHKSGYRYFLEDFAHDAAESGHFIESTVFVECNAMYRAKGPDHLRPVGETEFAVGMAAMAASGKYTATQGAAGIVAYADLTIDAGLLEEALEAHRAAANGRLRGIRQRAKWDADPVVAGPVRAGQRGLFLDPAFRRGLARLTKMGLSFDASIFHPQLAELISLARAQPDANIIVIHTASPLGFASYAGREQEVQKAWTAGMKELSRCPNVTVKLGGLLMCLGNFDFSQAASPPTSEHMAALWRPYIEPCIEMFGPSRCMVSSNFPVEKAGLSYGVLWNTFKRLTAGCSAEERLQLFADSARRIYRLE